MGFVLAQFLFFVPTEASRITFKASRITFKASRITFQEFYVTYFRIIFDIRDENLA